MQTYSHNSVETFQIHLIVRNLNFFLSLFLSLMQLFPKVDNYMPYIYGHTCIETYSLSLSLLSCYCINVMNADT